MNEKNYKGHLAMLTTNVLFGLNTPISKTLMPEYLNSGSLTYFRMAGAAIVFWITSIFIKKEKIQKKDLLLLFFASMLGTVVNQFSFVKGLALTTPIDAAIIVTTVPIFTMISSAIFLKEPITWKKAIGVLIGASGALLLITSSLQNTTDAGSMIGNLFCLLSCISYALYLTVFKNLINRYSSVTLMKWMFLYASIICLPLCYNDLTEIHFTTLPAQAYIKTTYVVLGATFITYLLIPVGQKNLRPTTLSMYNYVQPLVAAIVAVSLGLDTFGPIKAIAGFLVFAGVFVVTQSKSRAQIEAEKQNK